jgi:hypothetical protein
MENFHKRSQNILIQEEERIVLPGSSTPLPYWGLECSDAVTFYSLEGNGQHYAEQGVTVDCTPSECRSKRDLSFVNGSGTLNVSIAVDGNVIHRTHKFQATTQTELLDFVMRFVFPKTLFDKAVVAGDEVLHRDHNIYHQYALSETCRDVVLTGSQLRVQIAPDTIDCPKGFKPHLYVRDEKGYWIVHVRLLPAESVRTVTKLNYSFYNRAVPQFAQRLLDVVGVSRRLLYRGEKEVVWSKWRAFVYRLLPLTSYPLGVLDVGESITLNVRCIVQER